MNRVIPTLDGRNKQKLIFTQLQCKSVLNCLSSVLNKFSILGILLIETKPLIHSRFWSERKRPKRTNMHTYLPTPSIHKAFDVHTNSTCAFIKNGKLWFVVEKSSHLLYIHEKKQVHQQQLRYSLKSSSLTPPNLKMWVYLMLTQ